MFGDKKRFRASPVFDEGAYPPPELLKKSLTLIAASFSNSSMRQLDLMDTSSNQRLYGFMTTYESSNFCWIQPTRTMNRSCEVEYHKYMKRINHDAKANKLYPPKDYNVGTNIIAQYEVDNNFYRAIIVEEPKPDSKDPKWLVIFIDYGNFQYCNKSQIADIVEDKDCNHFHAPVQAVCCRLYNIVPRLPQHRSEIDKNLEEFYSKHSDTFLEILVRSRRCDYIVDCDVFLCRSGSLGDRRFFKRHIGQSLVDSGIASFADPKAAFSIMPSSPLPTEIITIDDDDEEEELKRKINIKQEVKININSKPTNIQSFVLTSEDNKNEVKVNLKREFKEDEEIVKAGFETPPLTQTPIKIKIEPMLE